MLYRISIDLFIDLKERMDICFSKLLEVMLIQYLELHIKFLLLLDCFCNNVLATCPFYLLGLLSLRLFSQQVLLLLSRLPLRIRELLRELPHSIMFKSRPS